MKACKKGRFLILLCCIMLLLSACRSNTEEVGEDTDMNKVSFWDQHFIDDSSALETALTKEYDLSELKSFFESSHVNENIGFGITEPTLTFSKVNQKFPSEIVRSGDYSVYRVRQGGYFYVFWSKPFDVDTNKASGEPLVYFSAYLAAPVSSDLFDVLTIGQSTAEDVKAIDPSFELTFLVSHGVYSYSYLNETTILEIEYENCAEMNEYEDLIVKEITIISRDSAPSKFRTILQKDLP